MKHDIQSVSNTRNITPALFNGGKSLVSTAYIYPVCPLSFNHARMFVIADVFARFDKLKGYEVYFPIATHYSGNTAHKVADSLSEYYLNKKVDNDITYNLFRHKYRLPETVIKSFTDPIKILDYFHYETIQTLKSLGIDADYVNEYTTKGNDYSIFINSLLDEYDEKGLVIENSKNKLGLKYEDEKWKKAALIVANKTTFKSVEYKKDIIAALKNIDSEWNLSRVNGYGVKRGQYIIDPMFDCELFSIFDLYKKCSLEKNSISDNDTNAIFKHLFSVINGLNVPKDELEKEIVSWLPCRRLICEEHLKNWVAKKIQAESMILSESYRTKEYRILGIGLIDGVQMSASKGTGVLACDLVDYFGPNLARATILLQGGNISIEFHYDLKLVKQIRKLLIQFKRYYTYVQQVANSDSINNNLQNILDDKNFKLICTKIDEYINNGDFRQAIYLLIRDLPKKYTDLDSSTAKQLNKLYSQYIPVFLPDYLRGLQYDRNI
ncbi:MAG: class I tRNA ligase family protein [Candidatus Saccharibacteria bacterium]